MNKIKVYIKSEENTYEIPEAGLAVEGHTCFGYKKVTLVKLPEDHERVKKMAEEVAREKGLDVEIHDLGKSFRSRTSAFFRGIKTPTIEIGNKRVNGVPGKEEILSLLDIKGTLQT